MIDFDNIHLAPRPWRVDEKSIHDSWTNSINIVDANGGVVAVMTRGYEGDENNDGYPSFQNARLIVKAVNALFPSQSVSRETP